MLGCKGREILFIRNILKPNLAERFYPLFQSVICGDISIVKQESSHLAEVRASLPEGEDVGIVPVIFHLLSVYPTVGSMLQLGFLQKELQNLAKRRKGSEPEQVDG